MIGLGALARQAAPVAAMLAIAGATMLVPGGCAFAATPAVDTESCSFVNPDRLQCFFLQLGAQRLQIQYVSVECGSTATFSLQEFQVETVPGAGSKNVPSYYIPAINQASVDGVVTAGSPVTLYAEAGSQPTALIDLTPAPPQNATQCRASISGILTP
jgi:hypothetical protein